MPAITVVAFALGLLALSQGDNPLDSSSVYDAVRVEWITTSEETLSGVLSMTTTSERHRLYLVLKQAYSETVLLHRGTCMAATRALRGGDPFAAGLSSKL